MKFEPLIGMARQAKLRRMKMECDPQCVLDLAAERDDYKRGAEVEARLGDEARAERDQLRAEVEMLREDAERFRYIERDCDSGMRGIYGDDWVEVIDSYIAEYAALAGKGGAQ